jgi:hypothetical protein
MAYATKNKKQGLKLSIFALLNALAFYTESEATQGEAAAGFFKRSLSKWVWHSLRE